MSIWTRINVCVTNHTKKGPRGLVRGEGWLRDNIFLSLIKESAHPNLSRTHTFKTRTRIFTPGNFHPPT